MKQKIKDKTFLLKIMNKLNLKDEKEKLKKKKKVKK